MKSRKPINIRKRCYIDNKEMQIKTVRYQISPIIIWKMKTVKVIQYNQRCGEWTFLHLVAGIWVRRALLKSNLVEHFKVLNKSILWFSNRNRFYVNWSSRAESTIYKDATAAVLSVVKKKKRKISCKSIRSENNWIDHRQYRIWHALWPLKSKSLHKWKGSWMML